MKKNTHVLVVDLAIGIIDSTIASEGKWIKGLYLHLWPILINKLDIVKVNFDFYLEINKNSQVIHTYLVTVPSSLVYQKAFSCVPNVESRDIFGSFVIFYAKVKSINKQINYRKKTNREICKYYLEISEFSWKKNRI